MEESHAVQSGKSNDHGDGLHENRAHCTNAWLVFTRTEEAVTWTRPLLGGGGARSLRTGRGSAWLHLLCVPQAATALRPSTHKGPKEGNLFVGQFWEKEVHSDNMDCWVTPYPTCPRASCPLLPLFTHAEGRSQSIYRHCRMRAS